MSIAIFRDEIFPAGGIETWLYYLAKRYEGKLTIYYKYGDSSQLARLRKLVDVVKYTGQEVKVDKALYCYDMLGIDNVTAKEHILFIHADYQQVMMELPEHHKLTKVYAVSNIAADSYELMSGEPIDTMYNPVELDKPGKVLKLVSATRLSEEKGWERMETLMKYLDKAGIEYEWQIFTPNRQRDFSHPNVVIREPRMNVLDYVARADYMVQLSDTESYGYSIVEALTLGVPVIVTKIPVLSELGITDEHGVIVDLWNMDYTKYISDIVDRKYKFKYTAPKDNYDGIFKEKIVKAITWTNEE